MPAVTIESGPWTRSRVDLCAHFLHSDTRDLRSALRTLADTLPDLRRTLRTAGVDGSAGVTTTLHSLHARARAILLTGLGRRTSVTAEVLRRRAAAAVRFAQERKATSLALVLPASDDPQAAAAALVEGALLGSYRYDRWKSRTADFPPRIRSLRLLVPDARTRRAVAAAVRTAVIACEGTMLARDLANAPGNELYPASLARRAADEGRRRGFRVRVLAGPALRRERMGGLIGVGRGSARSPRFIIMEHGRRGRRTPTIVLVGKGVTFDSGGISIKPSADMALMKMDMSGAAAVIGALSAAARLKLPIHLVGLVPAVENLPGGRALKPGDILTHVNGLTSEVDNTDAEGRLILADALAYAARYTPDAVIDLATLTGAVVVALGQVVSGMMGTDRRVMDELREAGLRTYERVWELPLYEEYEKLIASDVADVKNVGGRWAGAITAALFLKRFAGDLPWVHLDIAGTAIMESRTEYISKGGTGVGVRLLTDFLLHHATARRTRS